MTPRPFRTGTWRQALITLTGVLPVSLILNFVLDPLLDTWQPLLIVCLNAVILVAALNWVLLPALHYLTQGWAQPAPNLRRQE